MRAASDLIPLPGVPAPDRPIFIVGPHRSGTTLLYRVLSRHPEVGFLSQSDRRIRSMPTLAHVLRNVGFRDVPVEAQKFWDLFWDREDDVMTLQDATPEVVAWYRSRVNRMLELRGRPRFVAKYPRLSLRLDWIDALFPGTYFVHLLRDWRGVVNSSLVRRNRRRARTGRWYGVRIPGWRQMGDLPPDIVAGHRFRVVAEALERAGPFYGDRWVTIRYGDLCRDPVAAIRELTERCELGWTPDFERSIPRGLHSADHKWRTGLDPESIRRLRATAPELFARHQEGA